MGSCTGSPAAGTGLSAGMGPSRPTGAVGTGILQLGHPTPSHLTPSNPIPSIPPHPIPPITPNRIPPHPTHPIPPLRTPFQVPHPPSTSCPLPSLLPRPPCHSPTLHPCSCTRRRHSSSEGAGVRRAMRDQAGNVGFFRVKSALQMAGGGILHAASAAGREREDSPLPSLIKSG